MRKHKLGQEENQGKNYSSKNFKDQEILIFLLTRFPGSLRFLNYQSENLSLTFSSKGEGGLIFRVVHHKPGSFLCRANYLTKSEAGLHHGFQQGEGVGPASNQRSLDWPG